MTDHLRRHSAYDVALIALVTLAATCKWFNAGLPTGHDAIADMLSAQAAWDSIFVHHMLPGWSNDWFMGFPQFYVHPPLSSILVMASSVPFGWVLGTKLLFLTIFILSGVFAYFYFFELTRNRFASIVTGLAYVFLPYHIIDVGFEGHHGSFSVPYMLLPLILLCLERLIKKPSIKYVLINGVLLAILTLTFPQVFPLLIGPFLVLYVILRIWWERKRGREYLKNAVITCAGALCLSLLLTSFWWLPLISDMRYFYATTFSLEDAKEASATFLQAVTLRPSLCCATSSAYGSAGSALLEMLRIIPFILVLLGVALNPKNKYVWFFSLSTLIAVLLAMGPESPINVFGVAHRYVPFFTSLRTPVRFLLFTSAAYAVLIGFCVHGISERLKHVQIRKPISSNISFAMFIVVSLIIVGNTWQETRTAFSTFSLTADQEDALAWLAEQEGGDYRIADPPFDAYVLDDESGYMIRPTFWTFEHGKETVDGPGSSMAVKYTARALESLNTDLSEGPLDMSQWFNVFNVKYVLVDKTDPLSDNIVLDTGFERVWTTETLDIYENYALNPRVFSVTNIGESPIDLYAESEIVLSYAGGTREPVLSLSDDHTISADFSVKATCQFAAPDDWLSLEADVSGLEFAPNDGIYLVFYSERDLPQVHLSLDVQESDGSTYDVVLGSVDGINKGWNEVSFPLSLLTLRYSTDENDLLDLNEIDRLWIGVGRQGDFYKTEEFSLYFNSLSIVTQETDTNIEYIKIRPGKYEVHVSSDSPTCLVLSESYHPNWVARVNGKTIHSQLTYQALNGFYLDAGEYDITLEFTTSPLRVAGNIVTLVSFCVLCSLGVLLLVNRWRNKRRSRNNPTTPESIGSEV
ncbi:MAG: hypothetical protein JW753_00515 [Dehalococcoidia bacterium]|nr:hypothetical protein [Dehalococcoidia bacterium]